MTVRLSQREVDVLRGVATGRKQSAVAHDLGLSEQTVKNMLSGAYAKLDVSNAVAAFLALGWLRVPDPETATYFERSAHLRHDLSALASEAQAIADGLRALRSESMA